ncbi:hypothetical protein HS125_16535 [bacterium]|nr:hypothetical protein [bacterium]
MEGTPLFTFLYHYGLGGLLFLAGMLLAWRAGALEFSTRSQRVWVIVLLVGLLLYLAGHAFFQFFT